MANICNFNEDTLRKIEAFIQNLDDGLLTLDLQGTRITYNNRTNTETKTITDWILGSIREYEEERDIVKKFDVVESCLQWIRTGYANGIIKEGRNTLREIEEVRNAYGELEREKDKFENMYLQTKSEFDEYKQKTDRSVRSKLR